MALSEWCCCPECTKTRRACLEQHIWGGSGCHHSYLTEKSYLWGQCKGDQSSRKFIVNWGKISSSRRNEYCSPLYNVDLDANPQKSWMILLLGTAVAEIIIFCLHVLRIEWEHVTVALPLRSKRDELCSSYLSPLLRQFATFSFVCQVSFRRDKHMSLFCLQSLSIYESSYYKLHYKDLFDIARHSLERRLEGLSGWRCTHIDIYSVGVLELPLPLSQMLAILNLICISSRKLSRYESHEMLVGNKQRQSKKDRPSLCRSGHTSLTFGGVNSSNLLVIIAST